LLSASFLMPPEVKNQERLAQKRGFSGDIHEKIVLRERATAVS